MERRDELFESIRIFFFFLFFLLSFQIVELTIAMIQNLFHDPLLRTHFSIVQFVLINFGKCRRVHEAALIPLIGNVGI